MLSCREQLGLNTPAPINQLGADLLSLSDVVRAKIIQEYGQETNPLNLVAITDGARAIRQRLLATLEPESL